MIRTAWCRGRPGRNRWIGSGAFVVAGIGVAAAQLAGGRSVPDVIPTLIIFGAVAFVLAVGGRSESIRAFRGDLTDERLRGVELRAVAFSGRVVLLALVVAYIVEIVRGHPLSAYTWLLALGGVTYLAAWIYGMRR
ncbi:MAG TPA: hypothetical protein VGL69_01395 [Solirubrobacteraceae bacterium]|jgi:hypothetical protein